MTTMIDIMVFLAMQHHIVYSKTHMHGIELKKVAKFAVIQNG
jgi:hypothetical protein